MLTSSSPVAHIRRFLTEWRHTRADSTVNLVAHVRFCESWGSCSLFCDDGAESGQAYKGSTSLFFTDFRCGIVLRDRESHWDSRSRAHLAISLCCHGRSMCAALISFLLMALGRGALGGLVEALVYFSCLSCMTKTTTSYGAVRLLGGRR